MTIYNGYIVLSPVVWIVLLYTQKTVAAYQWPSVFASTTWMDNTRGTLSFYNSTLSGLTITVYGVTHSTWDCVDNSSSSKLVMKSRSNISVGSSLRFYAYLCLDLVQITSVSYYYYQRHKVQPNIGYERVHVGSLSNITSSSEICNFTVSIPTAEFHIMVKSGNASDAKVTCPSGILGKYDYVYYPKDNTSVLCNSSKDLWDGCTDKTTVTFNYTTCTQRIAYSAGGVVWCVANIGDTYGVVYNNDSSLVSSTNDKLATSRFSCIVGNHASASITPGNCTSQQTATSYPLKWNSVNQVNDNAGVYLTLSPYYTCAPSQSSLANNVNVGAIVGGVIVAVVDMGGLAAFLVFYLLKVQKSTASKMHNEEGPTREETNISMGPKKLLSILALDKDRGALSLLPVLLQPVSTGDAPTATGCCQSEPEYRTTKSVMPKFLKLLTVSAKSRLAPSSAGYHDLESADGFDYSNVISNALTERLD